MRSLHDAQHPLWPIIRVCAYTGCAALILMVTATHFDASELKSIGALATAAGAVEFVKRKLTA